MEIRLLKAEEIECKVSSCNNRGVQLLLYKTARTDMDLLDEIYGSLNWKCSYEEIKGNMYCTISIYDEAKKEWISKQDCGVESAFGDKEKGEASDAFKRAGFKVGIGRELYTSPFIWIPAEKCKLTENNGKFSCYERFTVESIEYIDRKISKLIISNQDGIIVYSKTSVIKYATIDQIEEAKKIGVNLEKVCNHYGVKREQDLQYNQLEASINACKKAKGLL